jgi:regulator of sigma E protease
LSPLALAHGALTWILPFLFVLTIVVTVHEFGHFLAARACGVAVDRFSIGFGQAIAHWRDRAGTEWRIGWIPLGGYVRFSGDENAASVPDSDDLDALRREIIAHEGPGAVRRYFHFKPLWQRAVVVAAGPFANFVLSTVLFTLVFLFLGETFLPAKVAEVQPGSAAAAAGFQVGDVVTRAAGRPIESFEDLREVVVVRAGVPIRFDVDRGGRTLELTATPKAGLVGDGLGGRQEGGLLGVSPPTSPSALIHRRYDPVQAVGRGAHMTWEVLDTTLFYLGRVVRGQVSANQLSGPLGIAQASHALAKAGAAGEHGFGEQVIGSMIALLGMVAVYSVGIGFLNLLPIPVLDGGHLLFYAYEAVARRPVGAAVQAASYRLGLALLVGLMLFATTNDLHRSGVLHFLDGLFS